MTTITEAVDLGSLRILFPLDTRPGLVIGRPRWWMQLWNRTEEILHNDVAPRPGSHDVVVKAEATHMGAASDRAPCREGLRRPGGEH